MTLSINSTPKLVSKNPISIIGITVNNPNSYEVFLKLFDSNSGLTLGTSLPTYNLNCPSGIMILDRASYDIAVMNRGLILVATKLESPTDTTSIDLPLKIDIVSPRNTFLTTSPII